MRILTLVAAILSLSTLAFAAPVKTDAAPAGQAQPQDRKGFQKKVQADLDDMNAKINALEAKSAKSGVETRKELKTQIKKLKSDMVVVKRKLKKLEKSSAGAWDSLKAETQKGVDGLEESYQKLADKFK